MPNTYQKFPISEFDLEKELKQDSKKVVKLQDEIDGHIKTIKTDLRKGTASKDFDNLGKILQAFLASKKVINYIEKS
ncbi:MAG: DUF5398 family protein [Chlamydiales bacterium]